MQPHHTTKLVYALMSDNNFTVDVANMLLRNYYFGDDAYSTLIQQHLPRVMLGRQKGHSSAVAMFARLNPHLQIGVKVNKLVHFQYMYRMHDNLHAIIDFESEHRQYDYIVFESVGTYGINVLDFKNALKMKKSTRIIGVGN